MDKIQVILTEDVANLGKSGELVSVKPGYGRNYLIPQGLALTATKNNVARIQHDKKVIEAKNAKTRKDVPTETEVSRRISKALRQEGFNFVGPTIVYAFMQAVGMVNDHLTGCFRHAECKAMAEKL